MEKFGSGMEKIRIRDKHFRIRNTDIFNTFHGLRTFFYLYLFSIFKNAILETEVSHLFCSLLDTISLSNLSSLSKAWSELT
jgi:hypothetical protein